MIRGTLPIAWREYAGFFRVPTGWVVASLLMLLGSLVFVSAVLRPGEPASLRPFFGTCVWMLVFIAPAISMRLLAEELRAGTIEPLMSSPAGELGVALGKFLGALGFYVTCLAPTLAYWFILSSMSRPDPGPVLAGYVGVVLLGSFYLSVGLLFSSLTNNQTLAFLLTLFALIGWEIGCTQGAARLPERASELVGHLALAPRIDDFAKGVVDSSHAVFFVALSALFIGLTALVLRARRWR